MGEGKGQAGHMAIDQERAFWEKWIADYEGPNIESEIACQFARAYAAECVRAATKEIRKAGNHALQYREHAALCEIGSTDFCSCGLKEAMDSWRKALKEGLNAGR